MNDIKYNKKMSILCPVWLVYIKVGCEILDKVGEFTRFILWCVENDKTISEITDVIDLNSGIVQDEIQYLLDVKYIEIDNSGKYVLSDEGRTFISIVEIIDSINQMEEGKGISSYINGFTGEIIDDFELYDDSNEPMDANIVGTRVNRLLVENTNYENSVDFIIGKGFFNKVKRNLFSDSDIYCTVTLQRNQPEKRYALYTLNIPADYKSCDDNEKTDIILKRTVLELGFEVENEKLSQKYRYAIGTIEQLKLLDPELLSDKARSILSLYENEKNINNTLREQKFYYDCYTGADVGEAPDVLDCGDVRDVKMFALPDERLEDAAIIKKYMPPEIIKGFNMSVKTSEITIKQRISFKSFQLVGRGIKA